jgi:plastocyanin
MPRLFSGACAVLVSAGALTSCGGSTGSMPTPSSPSPASGVTTVRVQDNSFEPRSITVDPGGTVEWVLLGQATDHTVTAENEAFDSGFTLLRPGATFRHTFTAADEGKTFNIYCRTHRACCMMQGSVRVGQSAPPPGPGY